MPAIVRIEIDVALKKTKAIIQGGSPSLWNNSATDFQIGVFENGVEKNLSEFSSLTVMLKPSTRRGASIKSVSISSLVAITKADWQAGTAQNGTASFSAQDMAVDLQTSTSLAFWLAIVGTDEGAEPVMLGGTNVTIEESGINLDGDGPTQGANLVAPGSIYDVSGNFVLAVTADVLHRWTKGANDTGIVNGTETLSASSDFTTQGASITLTGTPGAAVTSVIRYPLTLSADQTIALIGDVIRSNNPAAATITLRSPNGRFLRVLGVDDAGNFAQTFIDTQNVEPA